MKISRSRCSETKIYHFATLNTKTPTIYLFLFFFPSPTLLFFNGNQIYSSSYSVTNSKKFLSHLERRIWLKRVYGSIFQVERAHVVRRYSIFLCMLLRSQFSLEISTRSESHRCGFWIKSNKLYVSGKSRMWSDNNYLLAIVLPDTKSEYSMEFS